MKAGQTQFDVGTAIRVVAVNSSDPDDAIGVVDSKGTLTHPFGDSPDTILGVWVTQRGTVPYGVTFPDNRFSLCHGDTIELTDTGKVIRL